MENSEFLNFVPNEQILETLLSMGISRMVAVRALYYTGNKCAETAASFVFDNPDIAHGLDVNPERTYRGLLDDDSIDVSEEDEVCYKMVFVVNSSLGMGIGKIAAQVAHATLGLYRTMMENKTLMNMVEVWERIGEKKIVLKGESTAQLEQLESEATNKKIPSYLVHDAGHTQIAPNSRTVLSIFGEESIVNDITGKLKLL